MLRFVVAMDSFKGSLSSAQAGMVIEKAIQAQFPDAETAVLPMADGGEGTMDALVKAASGHTIRLTATGPLGMPADTAYGVIHRDTVVLETANVAGLTMVPKARRNPLNTTTFGLGELMRAALDEGYRKFIFGLGGSATNDGGMGLLRALGARFIDENGEELSGFGRDLARICAVQLDSLDSRIHECEIIAASDVRNPLCGPEGASMIFGLQKGASVDEAAELDRNMARYAGYIEEQLGRSLRDLPGAGAAGGLGFALLVLGAKIRPGALLIEEVTGLREKIAQADWIITGEGRSDGQSLYGKLPVHVAKIARECGTPAILISGSLGKDAEQLREYFAGCFASVREPATLQECMEQAESLLYSCACNVLQLLHHALRNRN